jgi:PAS domain S-box-containing protein
MKDLKSELFEIIQKRPEMLQYMQEIAGNCVWIWDLEDNSNGWLSPTFWQWLGYSMEEVESQGLTWASNVFSDDAPIAQRGVDLHLENIENPYDILIRYYHKNGALISMRCRGKAILEDDGKIRRMIGTLVKVDSASPLASFIDPNNFFELDLFFNLSDGLFCVLSLDGSVLRINAAWQELLGFSVSHFQGQNLLEFVYPQDQLELAFFFKQMLAFENKAHFTTRFMTRNGELKHIELKSVKKGKQIFIVGNDLTHKYAAQQALEESQNFIEKILKTLPSYIFIYDLTLSKVVFSNPWIKRYFKNIENSDLSEDALFANLIHEEDKIVMARLIHEMATSEDDVITERIIRIANTPIGTRYFKLHCLVFKRDSNGEVSQFCGKAQDVTSLIYAENKLIESEENQRALLEHGGDLYIVTSPTRLKYVSPNLTKILGYTEEEFRSIPMHELVHPNDFPLKWDQLKEPNDSITIEYQIKHKNGHYLWIEAFGINLFHVPAIQSMVFNLRDISERKKYELELEKQRELLEIKNKELEQFAYIASHDLQEPLRNITSLIELISGSAENKLDEEEREYLEFIDRSTVRMTKLIKGLLGYSKIGTAKERESVNLNSLIASVLEDLKLNINETNATFEIESLPTIDAYSMELRQLFQNLFTNAIKFRKPDLNPHINVSCKELPDKYIIEVRDNGVGVPEEGREKMFTIFNRLHSRHEYEGSGIGLAHCKKIADLHKGDIWFESEVGEGSRFYFSIGK